MTGLQRKEEGIKKVVMNNQEFVDEMRIAAREIYMACGPITMDYLRRYAEGQGISPKHKNCWGGILRGKGWKCIGRVPSEKLTNNGRMIGRYVFLND